MVSYQLKQRGLGFYIQLQSRDLASLRKLGSSLSRIVFSKGISPGSGKLSPKKGDDGIYTAQYFIGQSDELKDFILRWLRQQPDVDELPFHFVPVATKVKLPRSYKSWG